MRLPDFIGVGVARCATTWTFRQLCEHPQIAGIYKELNFFNEGTAEGLEEYSNYFEELPKDKIVGEWSPRYWISPTAVSSIQSVCPNAKILVNLRNPVERAYSWCDHIRKERNLKGTFLELFHDEKHFVNWKSQGLYYRHLKKWLDAFGDQVQVNFYDDLLENPQKFLRNIYKFLGVDPSFKNGNLNKTPAKRERGDEYYEVLRYYITPIKRLEDYLQKDLSHWYK
jgi:hypothetical protein